MSVSKYSFVYPSLGKRALRAVARRTPGLASPSNKPIGGKRCVAFTANKRPCRARPLAGSQLCPMHTPGVAQALGSRGGAAGARAQAVRAQHSPFHGLVAGVPRGSTLADLLEHDDAGVGAGVSPISSDAPSGIPVERKLSDVQGEPSPPEISNRGTARLLSPEEDAELFPAAHEPGPVSFYQWTNVDFDEGS